MKSILALLFILILGVQHANSQIHPDTVWISSEGAKVRGYFYQSNIPHSPTLIFTQGFMETGDIWGIGQTLSKNAINVLMFDFRGCFDSEGKQGLMNSQKDISAAYDFLKSEVMIEKYQIDTSKIILGGYSFGGHMSMLYAIYHPEVKRVISVSGGDLGIVASLMKSNLQLRTGYANFFQSIKKPAGPVDFQFDDPIEELMQNDQYFSILDQGENLRNVDIFMAGGLDDHVVSLEEYMLPLYRKIKRNKGQKIECRIYQTGHSYKNVHKNLLEDIIKWIKK